MNRRSLLKGMVALVVTPVVAVKSLLSEKDHRLPLLPTPGTLNWSRELDDAKYLRDKHTKYIWPSDGRNYWPLANAPEPGDRLQYPGRPCRVIKRGGMMEGVEELNLVEKWKKQ